MEKEEYSFTDTDGIFKKLSNVQSYKNLLMLFFGSFLVFTIGLGSFVLILALTLVPILLILTPFIYEKIPLEIGPVFIDTTGESIIVLGLGIIFLATLLFFMDLLVGVLKKTLSLRIGSFYVGSEKKKK